MIRANMHSVSTGGQFHPCRESDPQKSLRRSDRRCAAQSRRRKSYTGNISLYRLNHLVILGEWFGNTGLEVSAMGENRGGHGCKEFLGPGPAGETNENSMRNIAGRETTGTTGENNMS